MEELKARISEALESELAKIYTERGIDTGDISPVDAIRWDLLTTEAAQLFESLIDWNTWN